MQNFYYSIPTKIYFGDGEIRRIGDITEEFGKKVLLVYGGGSIKKIGIYDAVKEIYEDKNIEIFELSGIEPNPKIETIRDGIDICKANEIDVIVAIGGGSVIDSAKTIAAGVYYDGDAWDLVKDTSLIKEALPVITVLTIAATGSEMDFYAVVSNMQTNEKISIDAPCLFPKYSILDPTYTKSVSKYQTAAGVTDIISHVFEVYFNDFGDTFIQDQFCFALLKTCFKYGKIAIDSPDNYDARANIMWASSWAINGMIACGKSGAWVCHPMEHQLSAYYDVTHGIALGVIIPHWMRYILSTETASVFAEYGRNVFGLCSDKSGIDADMDIAAKAIEMTADYFYSLGVPKTLREIGITDKSKFEVMAKGAAGSLGKAYVPMTYKDVINIYEAAY